MQLIRLESPAIIAVQETHVKRVLLPRLEGYSSFSDTDSGCHRGVVLYFKDDLLKLEYHSSWEGSALWATCKGWPFAPDEIGMIGVVHLHPHCLRDETRLIKFLSKHSRKYTMILLGDLNLQPPPKADLSKLWFGNATSKLGRIVSAANLHLGLYNGPTMTHSYRRGSSTIDYVMGPAAWSSILLFSRVRADIPGSDHLPVMARWEIAQAGRVKPQSRPPRVSSSAILKCVSGMRGCMEPTSGWDVASLTDTVQQRLSKYRRTKPAKLRRYWIETGWLKRLRYKLTRAWRCHCIQRAKATWLPWRTLQLMWRAHCRDLRYQSWQNHLTKLSISVKRDSCWYFREAKKLMGKQHRKYQAPKLLDSHNQELASYEVPEAIRSHFSTLFAPRPVHDVIFQLHHQQLQDNIIDDNHVWDSILFEVSLDEIRTSLSNTPTQTAVGPDEISVEFWKVWDANEDNLRILAGIFSGILHSRVFPNIWREAWLVMIPKIPHPTLAAHYRGIAVTKCLYRIFMRILQKRVLNIVESHNLLTGNQFGFRPRRATLDAVLAVVELLQRRMSIGKSTYGLFLDIKQAYDSVSMTALRSALRLKGCSNLVTDFIVSIYESSQYTILIPGGGQTTVMGTVGLRQGCPLSATLFLLIMDQIIREVQKVAFLPIPGVSYLNLLANNDGHNINSFFFADDGLCLAETEWDLKRITDKVVNTMKIWGLTLNSQKSAVIYFSRGSQIPVRIVFGEDPVPQQTSYIYLGCKLTSTLNLKEMALYRLSKAEDQLKFILPFCKKLWHATGPVRSRLARAIAEPMALYGAEIWMIQDGIVDKCRRILGKLGQAILGSAKTSSFILNLLECGCLDPMVSVRARQLAMMRRISTGGASPMKTLLCCRQATDQRLKSLRADWTQHPGLARQLTGVLRSSIMDQWMRELKGSYDQMSIQTYMTCFWQRGIQELAMNCQNQWIVRMWHWARMDLLRYWKWESRLKRDMTYIGGCGYCKSVNRKDDRRHMIIECSAWQKVRESSGLGSMIRVMRHEGLEAEEIVKRVLSEASKEILEYLRGVCTTRGKLQRGEVEA